MLLTLHKAMESVVLVETAQVMLTQVWRKLWNWRIPSGVSTSIPVMSDCSIELLRRIQDV